MFLDLKKYTYKERKKKAYKYGIRGGDRDKCQDF